MERGEEGATALRCADRPLLPLPLPVDDVAAATAAAAAQTSSWSCSDTKTSVSARHKQAHEDTTRAAPHAPALHCSGIAAERRSGRQPVGLADDAPHARRPAPRAPPPAVLCCAGWRRAAESDWLASHDRRAGCTAPRRLPWISLGSASASSSASAVSAGKTSIFNRYVYDEFGKTSMVRSRRRRRMEGGNKAQRRVDQRHAWLTFPSLCDITAAALLFASALRLPRRSALISA